jgi:hypothetical protein
MEIIFYFAQRYCFCNFSIKYDEVEQELKGDNYGEVKTNMIGKKELIKKINKK